MRSSKWSDFKQPKLIGEGAYGKVYRAYYSQNPQESSMAAQSGPTSPLASPRSETGETKRKYTIYAVKVYNTRNVSIFHNNQARKRAYLTLDSTVKEGVG